jgi:hypothetical protein
MWTGLIADSIKAKANQAWNGRVEQVVDRSLALRDL